MSNWKPISLAITLSFLTGCAIMPPGPPVPDELRSNTDVKRAWRGYWAAVDNAHIVQACRNRFPGSFTADQAAYFRDDLTDREQVIPIQFRLTPKDMPLELEACLFLQRAFKRQYPALR